MADNVTFQTTAATPPDGTIVAADEIGGAKYQRVKPVWGVDGSAVDTSATNPLPVVQTGTPALPTGAATETTAAAALAALQSVILSGAIKVDIQDASVVVSVPGTVALDAGTLAALETIGLDAATLAALETITVANTDFPDAATLAKAEAIRALLAAGIAVSGPLTDAQLRAVAVPVSAASLPLPTGAATAANQATEISGLASIDGHVDGVEALLGGGLPSALAADRLKVDGSGVTQPVSAASLPLPTGAATAAKQPALGTAGSASADVLTVQGRAAMTPLLVDGSAATQPVSGPLTDAQLRATPVPVSGTVAVSNPTTNPETGLAKDVTLGTTNTAIGATNETSAAADNSTSGLNGLMKRLLARLTTLLAGGLPAALGAAGGLKVDGSGTALPVSAASLPLPTGAATETSAAAAATSLAVIDDWDESDRAKVNPIAGQAGVQGGSGAVSALTQRVVLATDAALPAGTNAIGKVGHDGSGVGSGRKVVTTAGTRVALATTTAAKWVVITAETDNTGIVVVGSAAGVIAALATREGTPLNAGDSISLPVDDLADVGLDSSVSGDGVTYTYVT